MSRAGAFLFSLGVGCIFVASASSGCSSTPGTSAAYVDGGASPGQGGDLNSVTDGTDAGSSNPSSGGDVAPTPVVASIAPTFASVGALGPTLVVTGSSFVPSSIVRMDATELTTTYFSSSELRASLPNEKLSIATTLHISVRTPAPGGGTSDDLPFEVRNPVPALTTLDPASTLAGSVDTNVTLTGSSFATHAEVFFDANELSVNSASATSISTTIPASLLKMSGSHNITVVNGAPGGGTSNIVAFTITNPNVSIASVSPSTAIAGDGNKMLSIVGAGFVGATTITFNGTLLSSSYTDGSHMSATLPSTSLTNAGNFPVVATNPAPGGGVSTPYSYQVQNPVPAIASLSPNTVFFGASDTTVTVNGSGFVPSSVVKLGSSSLTTTYVSSAQIKGVVPGSALGTLGNLSLTVVTPAPGGGTSNASQLQVTCDSTSVDVPLGAVGNITTRSAFYSSPDVDHLNSAACPTSLSTFVEPIDTFVVQNTTTSPVVLSSWAVCSVNGAQQSDGFLSFYRGSSLPADRTQCATGTVVSEGALGGAGNYTSPDANGSNWCPGLTKANGAGLTLAACEKAVVTLSPYSVSGTTNYPAPTQIRFEPESP